jgi:N-acetylmuramoyl-L-alanine amidase
MRTPRSGSLVGVAGSVALAAVLLASPVRPAGPPSPDGTPAAAKGPASVRVVVIDPGHGGADFGARGPRGELEKDVVLGVARRRGAYLERPELRVVYTRDSDEFVSLALRTELANRARGDVFLSIHANSAPDVEAAGSETYFLSVDASDEDARRVAMTENAVFDQPDAVPDSADIVGGILGDLIVTDHLRGSRLIAAKIQHNLADLPGPSRGVKQAPFVVLMGVNMPAVLVEIGFLTHPGEADRLTSRRHQEAVARAIGEGVLAYRAARDDPPPAEARP